MRARSGAGLVLVVLLAVYVVVDILLTPLAGFETRNPSLVTPLGLVGLGLLFLGLFGAIVSAVLLFRRWGRASMTAAIAAVLYFPAAITEWTGHFSQLKAPPAIATLELVQAAVAALVIAVALWRARRQSMT